jgi:hypothetical protein
MTNSARVLPETWIRWRGFSAKVGGGAKIHRREGSMLSDDWFYVQDAQKKGPLPLDALVNNLASLRDPHGTLAWNQGLQEWTKARNVPTLALLLPPPIRSGRERVLLWFLVFLLSGFTYSKLMQQYREFMVPLIMLVAGWLVVSFIKRKAAR